MLFNSLKEKTMSKIYIIAGENSGDLIGCKIIQNLPQYKFIGVGGFRMQQAGLDSVFDINQINLMGFFEILPNLYKIYELIKLTVKDILKNDIKLLITIDSPGFTFQVAKRVKKSNQI